MMSQLRSILIGMPNNWNRRVRLPNTVALLSDHGDPPGNCANRVPPAGGEPGAGGRGSAGAAPSRTRLAFQLARETVAPIGLARGMARQVQWNGADVEWFPG